MRHTRARLVAGFGALLFVLSFGGLALSQGGVGQGLLGYWPFDGDGADASGGGRNLSLVGGVGFANGLFGKALDLHNNDSQYAVRPSDDAIYDFGGGDFTVQVWVNFNSTSAEQVLIEKFYGATGPGWTLAKLRVGDSRGSNSLHFYANPTVVLTSTPPTLANGVWYQFLVRRSGTKFQVLLDGSVVAEGSASGSVPDTTMPLLVGKRNNIGGQVSPVDGRIDEVAIWSRALSDSEVGYLYNGGNGNRVISPAAAPPIAPTDLAATVSYGNPIVLTWTDNSDNEEQFEVERKPAVDTTFSRVGTTGPGDVVAAYQDAATAPDVAYTYRVRARNSAGTSGYSNEATITSSPLVAARPPRAPSGLVVVSATRDSVGLSWSDNSLDEVGFAVDRRSGNGEYEFVAMTAANASSFQDTGLRPDSEFVYGVRAFSATGVSGRSEADATTLPTLAVTALRGDLKDSPKAGKDSLKVSASYEFLAGESDGLADPVAEGITLRAGTDAAPVLMKLPPQAEGWKGEGSKWTWKSPRGALVKYRIQVDFERRLVTASAQGLELAVPPANPMRVSIGIGNDGGTARQEWEMPKTGVFRLR